jgi:selenocysteine-specific elongation factor
MIRVIGTAGHVDHGKSSLVLALTGMNPDRLREEQERQMTIDLGFAWMDLPDGSSLGWVDVPGHRDFIENMLAGVTGIDASVLVVAADEGVMPQTREHLAILDLLEVERLLVVLTKIDAVTDPEWIPLVREDVAGLLRTTRFAGAPITAVSSLTGEGLPALVEALTRLVKDIPGRVDSGRPRLPVDRVFTLAGFGTVVTGTLDGGKLRTGDEVELLPGGRKARIRGLQTHRRKVDEAVPGSRVAANLVGVDVTDVRRGDVVAHPGSYRPTRRVDVHVRVLPDAISAMGHLQDLKLFVGAAERMARLRLLEGSAIEPGGDAAVQIELDVPIVVARGDRFILRRPTPGTTLGGGFVLDPAPPHRYRRRDRAAARRLEALAVGGELDVVRQALLRLGYASVEDVARAAGLEKAAAQSALDRLTMDGVAMRLADAGWVERSWWTTAKASILDGLGAFHQTHPLRPGMPRAELRSRLGWEAEFFSAAVAHLAAEGAVREVDSRLALSAHEPSPAPAEEERLESLLASFAASPSSPPSVAECREVLGHELWAFALESGRVIQVSDEVAFRPEDVSAMNSKIIARLEQGPATIAQMRDLLGSSRKYVLALVERLDREGITVREGDERRLARPRRS